MYFVILAEGLGTRLRPYTLEKPKPLLPVGEKPILQHQLDWIYRYAKEKVHVLVMTAYLQEQIHEYLRNTPQQVDVEDIPANEPTGTAGAIARAKEHVKGDFYVTNGDILTDINYNELHLYGHISAIATVRMRSPYGILTFTKKKNLTLVDRFQEKPVIDAWINAGIYHFDNRIFNYVKLNTDIESTTFPLLAEQKQIVAYKYYSKFWMSIDSEKDWKEATLQYCKLLHPERYTGKTEIIASDDVKQMYSKDKEVEYDDFRKVIDFTGDKPTDE